MNIGVAIMMRLKSEIARFRIKSLGIERFCFFLVITVITKLLPPKPKIREAM